MCLIIKVSSDKDIFRCLNFCKFFINSGYDIFLVICIRDIFSQSLACPFAFLMLYFLIFKN